MEDMKEVTGSEKETMRYFGEKTEIKEMAKPLAEMLGEITNVANTKEGYGYKYAPLSEILDKTRPVLAKHGFSVLQLVSTTSGVTNNSIEVKTILMHASGEYISSTMELPPTDVKGTVQIQKMGASISYARRYMISSMLGIAGEEDTDGVTPGDRKDNKGMKEPPKVDSKKPAPAPSDVQKPKGLKDKLDSAVKMIDVLMNDNKAKLTDETTDFLDRQYEDIRSMPDSQDKYQQYRDFYAFIQKSIQEGVK